MIRRQRSVHRWLWVLLVLGAIGLLAVAFDHRPQYPVADEAAQVDPTP